MQPTVSIDEARLNQALRQFIADTGRDVAKVVRDQARLLTRDLIGGTPPFGKHAFRRVSNSLGEGESYNDQRKIGEAAVRRDVGRVFQSFRKYAAYVAKKFNKPKLETYLLQLARQSDTQTLERIFRKWLWRAKVRTTALRGEHLKRRQKNGRVKKGPAVFVLDDRSIKNYEREVVSHVGKAKAGWLAAARGLGVRGLPAWITRHSSPGLFQDQTGDTTKPTITIGNLVDFAAEIPETVWTAALENRMRSMKIEAEKVMEANHRKHARRAA